MKRIVNGRIGIIAFVLFFHLDFGLAKQHETKLYKIRKLYSCNSIKIGEKEMKLEDCFQDNHTIYWTNARQSMVIQEYPNGPMHKIPPKGFTNDQVESVLDIFTKIKTFGNRSLTDDDHYSSKEYFLVDSLLFPTFDEAGPKNIIEAVWDCDGEEIVTSIERTLDGKFYIITPNIYGNKSPDDIILNIREREIGEDWENNVYQGIQIIYIPPLNETKVTNGL